MFGKDGFKLIDTYRMKAGVSLTDFSLSQIEEEDSCRHNIMALLVKNGQKLQEVIIGGTDKKQIRLQCKLGHTFSFKLKAVQVLAFETDKKIYLVRDQLGKGFIFKAISKTAKTLTLNRLQNTEAPIQLILSLDTGIVFLTST